MRLAHDNRDQGPMGLWPPQWSQIAYLAGFALGFLGGVAFERVIF